MFTKLDIGKQLYDLPEIYVVDDFISDDHCEHIINLAKLHLKRAVVSAASSGVESAGRTGSVHWIKHDTTPAVQEVVEKVSKLVEIPRSHAESLQVIYYDQTQQYKPHFDAYDMETSTGKRCTANGGQRLLTALLYLNDVEQGGNTVFPKIKQFVAPRKGRITIFKNCYSDTNKRHPFSLHAGEPVAAGHKWACNLWFREAPRV